MFSHGDTSPTDLTVDERRPDNLGRERWCAMELNQILCNIGCGVAANLIWYLLLVYVFRP